MPGLLTSRAFFEHHADELKRIVAETGFTLEHLILPSEGRVDAEVLPRIELAYFSGDIRDDVSAGRRFFGALTRAPNLRWIHVGHAGIDDPVFGQLLENGARLSTSSGSTAEPIAQSAIAGLLALGRGFPHWIAAQQRHEWTQHPPELIPDDLRGQTLLVLGVGAIGNEIARLARAIGLYVIGVRRSPATASDHVDEMHPPRELEALLPRTTWLAIACPLTEETRGLIDAKTLELLPRGARMINIARGEIVDEPALTEALQSGHLGGAYLDVFAQEPLPADSPLWDMPGVLISPHNSAASTGNRARADHFFVQNLTHWARSEPLINEITEP
jgi:phosphoglycerate dehydrogenase-like enzyme